MTEQERNKILNICNEILNIDIKNHWIEKKPTVDFENFSVCQHNGIDGLDLIYRVTNQLKLKIETSAFKYLPIWCDAITATRSNQGETYTSKLISLLLVLENFKANILKLDNNSISNEATKIIRYQMTYSFWDSSTLNIYNSNEIDIASKLESLKKASIAIDKKIEGLNNAKKNFDSTIQNVPQKIESIEKLLKNAEIAETSINTINTDVATTKGALNAILDEQKSHTESFRTKLDEFNIKDESYQTKLNDIDTQKNQIEEDKREIEKKKEEIEEIIGLVSNGALVHTFADRAKTLKENVRKWIWINIAFFVISCFWLIFSFELSNSFAEFLGLTNNVSMEAATGSDINSTQTLPSEGIQKLEDSDLAKITSTILLILASGLKILPVWLLMQFGFKNYTRERRTLEAYEFKAAVASTLSNYADQMISTKYSLKKDDFGASAEGVKEWEKYVNERDKDRKDLIRNTVDSLYKEIKFCDDELRPDKANAKDWKKIKEIFSIINDTNKTITK